MQCDKNQKEDAEWPALNDVVSKNLTDGRYSRARSKDTSNNNCATGYKSSKENKGENVSPNSGTGKKKKASKILWQPLQIETQPYRKRGTGRHVQESNNKGLNRNKFVNTPENGRRNPRNEGFRGRRNRACSNYRSQREEDSSTPETSLANEIYIYRGVTFFPQSFSDVALKNMIKYQMEYYFSDDNLCKDIYMQQRLDSEGFMPLKLFLTFPMIMNLTNDVNVIAEALKSSNKLEVQRDSDEFYVRRIVDPVRWRVTNHMTGLIETAVGHCNSDIMPQNKNNLNGTSLNDDNSNTASPSECNSVVTSPNGYSSDSVSSSSAHLGDGVLINQFENLHLSSAASSDSAASSVEPTDVQHCLHDGHLNNAVCLPSTSPSEPDIELNGILLDEAAINSGYYSHTSNPLEQINGFNFYAVNDITTVCNDVIFYDNSQMSEQGGTYYFSNSAEVLSNGSDNCSCDEMLHNRSPEPAR